jgi:hypothetical protein
MTARMTSDAMIMVGDFNCEPWDTAFGSDTGAPNRLAAVRERALVLQDRYRLTYFYNLMWRWSGEPDVHEVANAPGYLPPRLIGTYRRRDTAVGWHLLDQLMVTKSMLRGPMIRLEEGSVRVKPPANDCSDHCALCGTLLY